MSGLLPLRLILELTDICLSMENHPEGSVEESRFDTTAKGKLNLLSLPNELLEQILWKYFEDINLVLSNCDLNDHFEPFFNRHDSSKVLCKGMPSLILEQTCQRIRRFSVHIRAKCFDGTILLAAANFRNLRSFCSPNEFEWLRQRLVKFRIDPGITASHDILCYQRPSPIWELLVSSCPLLKVCEFYSDFYLPFNNHLREADFPTTPKEHISFVSDAVQLKFDYNTDAQMGNNTMFDLGKAFEKAHREDSVVRYIQRQYYFDNTSSGEYELVSRGINRYHYGMLKTSFR